MIERAIKELTLAGFDLNGGIEKNVIELLEVFVRQNHSNTSAPRVAGLFQKLALYEILAPLTGEDDEWGEITCSQVRGRRPYQQNKRCSGVFRELGDDAYYIEGIVFRKPNGLCYTTKESKVTIEFPYTPSTRFVDVPDYIAEIKG